MLISFSGIDSSGKSTQIQKLGNYFINNSNKVKVVWSRGGYTPLFNIIKVLLRKIMPATIPDPGESKLRDETFNKKWVQIIWINIALFDMILLYGIFFRILLILGYNIIADRYVWDTYIDFRLKFLKQNIKRKILWKILVNISPKPDFSFLLTIPIDESLHRSKLKNEPFSENLIQRKKRFDMYQNLIDKSKWDFIIDGMKPIDEICLNIRNILK